MRTTNRQKNSAAPYVVEQRLVHDWHAFLVLDIDLGDHLERQVASEEAHLQRSCLLQQISRSMWNMPTSHLELATIGDTEAFEHIVADGHCCCGRQCNQRHAREGLCLFLTFSEISAIFKPRRTSKGPARTQTLPTSLYSGRKSWPQEDTQWHCRDAVLMRGRATLFQPLTMFIK